VPLGS